MRRSGDHNRGFGRTQRFQEVGHRSTERPVIVVKLDGVGVAGPAVRGWILECSEGILADHTAAALAAPLVRFSQFWAKTCLLYGGSDMPAVAFCG